MRVKKLAALIGTLAVISITVTASPAFADCKDEIEDVDKEMRDNRDKYTADALRDARKSLQECAASRQWSLGGVPSGGVGGA